MASPRPANVYAVDHDSLARLPAGERALMTGARLRAGGVCLCAGTHTREQARSYTSYLSPFGWLLRCNAM